MIQYQTQVRVRYGETDQMGYVYYGKYAEYFEVGRVELIRSLGLSYKEIEARGVWLPVAHLHIEYKAPGKYDDLLTVTTSLAEIPRSNFLTRYEVHNEAEQLIVTGEVKLAFFDAARQRPVRVPDFILAAVQAHWPQP